MTRVRFNLFASDGERFIPSSPAALIGAATRFQSHPATIVAADYVDEQTISVTLDVDEEWPGAVSDSAGRNPRPG